MANYDPNQVVLIASVLLHGRFEAEPHHIKKAIASARRILDEAHAGDEPEEVKPAVAEEPAPPDARGRKKPD